MLQFLYFFLLIFYCYYKKFFGVFIHVFDNYVWYCNSMSHILKIIFFSIQIIDKVPVHTNKLYWLHA